MRIELTLGSADGSVAVEESIVLPATAINVSHVLQIFDVLRRRLAQRVTGDEGMFPGYDRLDIWPIPSDLQADLECTAAVTEYRPGMQSVRFAAVLRAPFGTDAVPRVVATGHGRTIGLPT